MNCIEKQTCGQLFTLPVSLTFTNHFNRFVYTHILLKGLCKYLFALWLLGKSVHYIISEAKIIILTHHFQFDVVTHRRFVTTLHDVICRFTRQRSAVLETCRCERQRAHSVERSIRLKYMGHPFSIPYNI